MRIANAAAGAVPAPEPIRISSFGLPVTLDEGDSFTADVISSGNGSAVLKTEDGRIFHAKLDGGAALVPGENVELVVDGKADGVITLTIIRENGMPARAGEAPGGSAAANSAPAATDARGQLLTSGIIASRLEALGLPSGAATVAKVIDLLLSHPSLTADEAVFVAAQGLDDAPDTLVAVKALLSGGETLNEALTEIQRLLDEIAPYDAPDDAPATAPGPPPDPSPLPSARYGARVENSKTYAVPDAPDAPSGGERTHISPERAAGAPAQRQDAPAQQPVAARAMETASGAAVADDAAVSATAVAEAAPQRAPANSGNTRARAEADAKDVASSPEPAEISAPGGAGSPRVPHAPIQKSASEFIKDMFVPLGGEDGEDGAVGEETARRLRSAHNELPARAALLASSAARFGAPGADAIADRAGRVAEQARVMSSAEQYAYAQFPVVVSGEDSTAELYVFKRKKAAISPEDANILLSLNLPSLGHWEATVNVRGRDVSLHMRAADDGAREHLSGSTARLHEMLSEAGYRLTGARVTCGDGDAATPLTACSRAAPRLGAGIDVIV
ncbi:MAG: flagellar hook-length control protein FliK [Oscillospiraceae bacterium]|jgi:hypothetical protein|nr:flagellar hook-length control protein FliK [Oscillospiraceae bacterium]